MIRQDEIEHLFDDPVKNHERIMENDATAAGHSSKRVYRNSRRITRRR